MKKTKIMFVACMLGISMLAAGCSGEKTLSQSGQETRAQWGLNFHDGEATETEMSEKTETAEAPEEKETDEAETTAAFTAEVTELDSGVRVTSIPQTEVHALQMVNVRSGPGAGYAQLGILSANEAVAATGTCDNGWIRVLYKDKEGYVSSRYLESLEQAAAGTQTSAAESSVAESSAAESSAAESSAAESSAVENSAAESQAASSQENGQKKAWAKQDVHVRSGPGTSYEMLGNLPKNGMVLVLDDTDAVWWKVDYDGKEAYISTRYLTTNPQEIPGFTPSAAESSGQETSKQETSKQESQAAAEGKAWAVSSVYVHSGPGMSYGNIGTLSGGQEVGLLDSSSGWWKISYKGGVGYVYRSYLTKSRPQ